MSQYIGVRTWSQLIENDNIQSTHIIELMNEVTRSIAKSLLLKEALLNSRIQLLESALGVELRHFKIELIDQVLNLLEFYADDACYEEMRLRWTLALSRTDPERATDEFLDWIEKRG